LRSHFESTGTNELTELVPWLVGVWFLVFPFQLIAQSFDVTGGTSSLINASGFAVNYKWAPVQGWVGLGATPEVRMGGALRTEYQGYDVSIGDQMFPYVLDTDVFERDQYFDALGLALSRRTENQSWVLFAGTAATDFSTSFARSFASSGLTGAFFYNRTLNSRLSLTSRNIFRRDLTSIQSVGLQLMPNWKISAAGGIGANTPYASLATQYKYKWIDATAAYITSGQRFQRIRVTEPIIAERTGPNLRLRFTPVTKFSVQFDSQHILVPSLLLTPPVQASLNGVTAAASLLKFSLSGSYSESKSGLNETRSQVLSVGRSLGSKINLYGSAIRAVNKGSGSQLAYVATLQEKISPRLSLLQTMNISGGRTTAGYGGQFLSNRITLGANYQTIFNPLAYGFGAGHIYQAWMINVGIALPGGGRFHFDNFLDPFGRVRYTGYASGVGYNRDAGFGTMLTPTAPVRFYENIVQGSIKDERGEPVWGIAVKIGKETVYSDKSGQFFLRVKDLKEHPLSVSMQDSVNPARYELVSAPTTAVPEPVKSAKPLTIIVRRIITLQRRVPAN